jgi:hypothetical protein
MRVFAIMARKGKFDDLAPDMVGKDENGNIGVRTPAIQFTSKLALAMRAVQSNAMVTFQTVTAGFVSLKPDLLDNIQLDGAYRRLWTDLGLPKEDLMSMDDVDAMRSQREQMQQMAMAAQAAPGIAAMAKAAKA